MSRIAPLIVLALVLSACASAGGSTVRVAQERHACADVGMVPGSAAFANCVGSMDKMLFDYDNRAAR